MNQKSFLRGLGIGILLTAFTFIYIRETETVSDKEIEKVLDYAKEQGYLQTENIENKMEQKMGEMLNQFREEYRASRVELTPNATETITPSITETPNITPPLNLEENEDPYDESDNVVVHTFTNFDTPIQIHVNTTVNVRLLPKVESEKIGVLYRNSEIWALGICNENGWYKIDYNGTLGFISGNYVIKSDTDN